MHKTTILCQFGLFCHQLTTIPPPILNHFWSELYHHLITVPINNGMTRNLLTHYGQVSIKNTRAHAATYVNTPTRDTQDNDMFYYFLLDLLTNNFHTTVLLYADVYTITNVPIASLLLKQVIILTRVDNPASTMHIREMLIASKHKLLLLKGNITEFNQWVRKQMGCLHTREQEAVDLQYYLWKAYKAALDNEFVTYIKDLKSQCDDGRATFMAEDLMVHAENKYEAQLLDKENNWGKPTEDQEKIVAMTEEINSLKKECRGTTAKNTKPKPMGKKQATKKALPKKTKEQKKKANDKWAWKSKPPKEMDSKEDNAFIKTFENKKYFWCLNHNDGVGMRLSITQKIVRPARLPPAQWPMPTLLLLTLWTATLTRNDSCARVKSLLGSGSQSPTIFYGCCSLMKWDCQSWPSSSRQVSFFLSCLIVSINWNYNHMSQNGVAPPRASGLSSFSRP